MVVFTLSFPNRGSWNNKWTGDGRIYCRIRPNRSVPKESQNKQFIYDFGDGWVALVTTQTMDSKDAHKLEKKSMGFSGYDWMIESIIKKGDIFKPNE